jgi:hypothetical protein
MEQGHPRQGPAQHVRSVYAGTTRAVHCGQHTDCFDIVDLSPAQGDTLSCILFDIFVDDLLRERKAASQGVPLPVRPAGASNQAQGQQAAGAAGSGPPVDDAGAAPAATLKALMFADEFTGVAETEEALRCIINTCYAWCTRWRMAANCSIAANSSENIIYRLPLLMGKAPMFPCSPREGGVRRKTWGDITMR